MQTEIFLILSLQIFQKCYLYVAICKTGKFNQIQFAEEKISSVERTALPVQCNTVILQYLHFLLFLKNCTFRPPAAIAEYIQYIHKGQVETFSSDSSESSIFL